MGIISTAYQAARHDEYVSHISKLPLLHADIHAIHMTNKLSQCVLVLFKILWSGHSSRVSAAWLSRTKDATSMAHNYHVISVGGCAALPHSSHCAAQLTDLGCCLGVTRHAGVFAATCDRLRPGVAKGSRHESKLISIAAPPLPGWMIDSATLLSRRTQSTGVT